MTGYGRAEAAIGDSDWLLAIELTGVNRKQTDIVVNLPNRLAAAEADARKRIAARISRGRINARVTLEKNGKGGGGNAELRFDKKLAEQYLAAIDSISEYASRGIEFRQVDLLRAPGVFSVEESSVEAETALPTLFEVLDQALDRLVQMQHAEGEHLRADFVERLTVIADTKNAIAERAPTVIETYRENLHARLQKAGLESDNLLDDDRVVRELALFADRCDISEELTRIDSHMKQFDDYLAAAVSDAKNGETGDAIGRPLDFLCQELNREFNTIGSKANDSGISKCVVTLKTELEKVREQVQNVQ